MTNPLREALRSMDVPWREAVGCLREIWTKNVEMLWMKNVEMLWMKNVFFMEKINTKAIYRSVSINLSN